MMRRRSAIALGVALLGTAVTAQLFPPQAQTGGWVTLFDGKNLDQWSQIGDANWTLADGIVSADKGTSGFLVSKASFGDFQIRAEFWVDSKANSGIFIRCEDPSKVTSKNGYEVNIYDERPDLSYGTGAIVDVAKVDPMPKAGGKWNVMEITAKGPLMSVILNGETTVKGVTDTLHSKGVIGLQYRAGIVKFRKFEIRPL